VIRTNLATRPFYNERAVHVWLLLVALIVIAATVFNVSQAMRYRRSDTQLVDAAQRDEARASELQREAGRLRASVDPRRVDVAASAARTANDLIDRRTFSWTELLNHLETTLPDDVHVVSIRPKLDRSHGIVLTLNVLARDVDDVNQFLERLEQTGAFRNPRATQERVNEQNLYETQLEAEYTPANARPSAAQAGRQ
jgi:type IV pilus assembly protein PilN